VGITKVTCKAMDEASNEGSASFNVNVSSTDALALSCPAKVAVVKGTEGSIDCRVENRTFSPLELNLSCSQLDEVGIECYINGNPKSATMSLAKSSDNFHVVVSSKSTLLSPGICPITISANCKEDSC
jgi:hypothetical protein